MDVVRTPTVHTVNVWTCRQSACWGLYTFHPDDNPVVSFHFLISPVCVQSWLGPQTHNNYVRITALNKSFTFQLHMTSAADHWSNLWSTLAALVSKQSHTVHCATVHRREIYAIMLTLTNIKMKQVLKTEACDLYKSYRFLVSRQQQE